MPYTWDTGLDTSGMDIWDRGMDTWDMGRWDREGQAKDRRDTPAEPDWPGPLIT